MDELPSDYQSLFAPESNSVLWHTSAVQAGDLILFDIRTVHASTTNSSKYFRISVDTRWQPFTHIPASNSRYFRFFEKEMEAESDNLELSTAAGGCF